MNTAKFRAVKEYVQSLFINQRCPLHNHRGNIITMLDIGNSPVIKCEPRYSVDGRLHIQFHHVLQIKEHLVYAGLWEMEPRCIEGMGEVCY